MPISPEDVDEDFAEMAVARCKPDQPLGNQLNVRRMLSQFQGFFVRYLNGDTAAARKFIMSATNYVAQDRKGELAKCDELSFVLALCRIAEIGLMPGPQAAHAYLVPFADTHRGKNAPKVCTLIVGYRGYVHCAYRSNRVAVCTGGVVRAGDDFEWEEGSREYLRHRKKNFDPKSPVTFAWSMVKILQPGMKTPHPLFRVLPASEIEKYRGRSRAKESGPWVTDYDAMATKTAFRRLVPWVPMSWELERALDADEEERQDPEMRYQLQGVEGFTGGHPEALVEEHTQGAAPAARAPSSGGAGRAQVKRRAAPKPAAEELPEEAPRADEPPPEEEAPQKGQQEAPAPRGKPRSRKELLRAAEDVASAIARLGGRSDDLVDWDNVDQVGAAELEMLLPRLEARLATLEAK